MFEKNDIGVHQEHCCVDHGCKYGDDYCPVVLGTVKQNHPCETCEECEPEPLPINIAGHARHCCNVHGCKYGNKNCPVELGTVEQEQPCELCDEKILIKK